MKAIVCERYGPPDVLRLVDLPKPEIRPDEVLIRTRAATVTMGDCELRAFRMARWAWLPARLMFGITRPRNPVLGMEIAGEIAAVGSEVDRFRPGDRVFGSTSFAMGAWAQYTRLKQGAPITTVPDDLGFAQAAGIPTGGLNGLHFVHMAKVRAGEKVLINGAAGSIGMFATQIAKLHDAEVTAVDRGDKLDMLREIGADHVIDYQKQDVTKLEDRIDVVIDVVGKLAFAPSLDLLVHDGRLVLGNPQFLQMVRGAWLNRKGGKQVLFKLAGEKIEDLDELKKLVTEGAVRVIIDRHFALEDMAAAHAYVEAGNKTGVVAIDLPEDDA